MEYFKNCAQLQNQVLCNFAQFLQDSIYLYIYKNTFEDKYSIIIIHSMTEKKTRNILCLPNYTVEKENTKCKCLF